MKFLWIFLFTGSAFAADCHYSSWDWDTQLKKSTGQKKIAKNRAALNFEEKGSVPGCSICEEDQTEIHIGNIPAFKVCKRLIVPITKSISASIKSGYAIHSVTGYRVGKSKGALSSDFKRTQFSNHSYGIAVDINSETNGLYDNCKTWNTNCRLIRGGKYDPKSGITKKSVLYKEFHKAGFHWGGELPGQQKDFMHFSLGRE